jgi:bile acid:Na+ symporter, BASS family
MFQIVIILALLGGLFLPNDLVLLAPFATIFLQVIFFLTSLKIDFKKVLKEIDDVYELVVPVVAILLVFPTVVYLVSSVVAPSLAVGLLLLAAMPIGMTAPLLVEVLGGKVGMALVLTVITSLLAPFSIPFVVGFFASTAVTVSAGGMFVSLAKVILVPFVLAQIIRHFWNKKIKFLYPKFKPTSIVLLGLLIAGVVARQSETILDGIGTTIGYQLVVLTVFIAVSLFIGYFLVFWESCEDRVTVSACFTFMNFTLAIYLAGEFFVDPAILLATVLVIFPWSLILFPYRWLIRRFVCKIG